MTFPTQFILAAAEVPEPTNVVVTGFLFVVLVLCLLFLITFLAGKVFAVRPAAAPAEEKKAPRAAEVQAHKQEEENRIAAVITAAVHVAMQDQRFRVRSIHRTAHGWAQEGRREIFSSHRLR